MNVLTNLAASAAIRSIAAMILFSTPMLASATTINFDQYAGNTIITNQYASQGVVFQNTVEVSGSFNPGYPTHSGAGEITDGNFVNNITATFSTPSATVSGYYTDPYGIQLQAYNSAGTLVATANLPDVYSAINPFSITASSGISSLVFLDLAPNSLTAYEGVDDLTFGAATASAPEISASGAVDGVVLLSGCILILRGRRRLFSKDMTEAL